MEHVDAKNKLAIACLILAKISGMIGLGVGYLGHRHLGGTLLFLDGLMLLVAVILAVMNSRSISKNQETEKEILSRMIFEGTLRSHLKELGYK